MDDLKIQNELTCIHARVTDSFEDGSRHGPSLWRRDPVNSIYRAGHEVICKRWVSEHCESTRVAVFTTQIATSPSNDIQIFQ